MAELVIRDVRTIITAPAGIDLVVVRVDTSEPGLYGPELRGGIRIENDYLVTSNGVELLSPFPEGL